MIQRCCTEALKLPEGPSRNEKRTIIGSLVDSIRVLLNLENSEQAVLEYEDAGPILMMTFLMNDGDIAELTSENLSFISTMTHREDLVDHWIDAYAKIQNERYRMESLMDLMKTTENEKVAKALLFFVNLCIKSHITLFKRITVKLFERYN